MENDFVVPSERYAASAENIKSVAHVRRALYFLFDEADKLIYIGRTQVLKARIIAHLKMGRIPFCSFSYVEVPTGLKILERQYIYYYKPPYNKVVTDKESRTKAIFWIPVKVRLPEKVGNYLVTFRWVLPDSDDDERERNVRVVQTCTFYPSSGWVMNKRAEVTAWMYQPEPYNP